MLSVNTPPLVRNARSLSRCSSAWSRLWHGGHQLVFLWGRWCRSLRCSFAGMDLVFHAVQTRHQQGGKAQVGFISGSGKRASTRRPLGWPRKEYGSKRSGSWQSTPTSQAPRVRNQTLVAVGARVCDGVQGTGVLDDAANVVQSVVRQASVAVASEQVLAVFPRTGARACRSRCRRGKAWA